MSDEQHLSGLVERVRLLATEFASSDLLRLSIERKHESIEFGRHFLPGERLEAAALESAEAPPAPPRKLDVLAADLVGIFHLSRPQPSEGESLEGDRELAYIEALGIRNPVRSRGEGRIVRIRAVDGNPVEYGQPLFELDRG